MLISSCSHFCWYGSLTMDGKKCIKKNTALYEDQTAYMYTLTMI